MKNYNTLAYATSNEDGMEQITFTYRLSLVQLIKRMIEQRTYKVSHIGQEEWVYWDEAWHGKYTWRPADYEKQMEIFHVKRELLRNTRNLEASH